VTNGTIYLGGNFTYIGPDSGSAGVVDINTGDHKRGFPKISGSVFTVIPDGSGGWYIGGAFTNIGGTIRTNIAHINADNSISGWSPHANNVVRTMVGHNGQIYVGGAFTRIGGVLRNRLAALNPDTGAVAEWNPNAGGVVNTMELDELGETLYIGGAFTTVGGTNRNRIASLILSNGIPTEWNPDSSHPVNDIVIEGTNVYAGGNFTTIGGQPRNRIAALSDASGAATGWNPSILGGNVTNVAVFGNVVYASGSFMSVAGQIRGGLAAIDAATALPTTWNPGAFPTNVTSLLVTSNAVYVGGSFTNIAGETRPFIAAIDPTNGIPLSWAPGISDLGLGVGPQVMVLSLEGDDMFVGGSFPSIGGESRNYAGAIDVATGEVTDWNPSATGPVNALVAGNNTIYAGGTFTNIGGQLRNRIAALTSTTGEATLWDPNIRGRAGVSVLALLLRDDTLYVGGMNTTNVNGQLRTNLFALSVNDGQPTSWAPHAIRTATAGNVASLQFEGTNSLIVAGDFLNIAGQARSNLVAVALDSTTVEDWNTFAHLGVSNFVTYGNTVYAGGAFNTIGTVLRNRIGAVDRTTGLGLLNWNPDAGSVAATRVSTMAKGDQVIYVGGSFNTMGGSFRTNAAGVFVDTGVATSWTPRLNGFVRRIVLADGLLVVGGDFTASGNTVQPYLAVFDAASPEILSSTVSANDGLFQFTIRSGESLNTEVVIERAVNGPSNFTAIATSQITGTLIPFTDPEPITLPARYYRAYARP
jgi:hypothetical protein